MIRILVCNRRWFPVCLVIAVCMLSTQAQTIISDESKQKQVRSMEFIEWDFAPAIYYGWGHYNYSGAKNKFLGLDYSFHEDRSNVKRNMWIRSENLGIETLRLQDMIKEHEAIDPIYKEELILEADRLIDPYYSDYEETFEKLRQGISRLIEYSVRYTNGALAEEAMQLSSDYKVINEHITFLHKTGPGYEMASADRHEGYEQALSDLKHLHSRAQTLFRSAVIIKDKNRRRR